MLCAQSWFEGTGAVCGKKKCERKSKEERDERKMREKEGFRQQAEIKNQNGLHSIPCETSRKGEESDEQIDILRNGTRL